MSVRAENSFASASACCCSSSISSIMIGSWRVHEEQGTSFFSGCQPRGTNSGTETGTGKIQEQVWCVHPQWTNHLPLPPLLPPSSAHAHAHAAQLLFAFLLTTTHPDWQKGTAPQPPRLFPGFPRTAPRLAATALVCASPESTQAHATSRMGRRRERKEGKKRTDSAPRPRVDHWTSSHPHLTGVDHTEDVPHLHEPPMDLVRPNHRHRGRLGMQGTDPPSPFTESVRPSGFPSFQVSTPPRPPRPGLGLGPGPALRPVPLVPLS